MGKWIIGMLIVVGLVSGSSSSNESTPAPVSGAVEAVDQTDVASADAERLRAERQARRAAARAARKARAQQRRAREARARRREARARDREAQALAASQEQQPADDCDSNYEGACLDPAASDYDCEGGSGDGPDYTGMVRVVGDDVHDLDRDGDGIACDA